ncbi:hypothetical protein BTVI_115200 [Pitangus sulphuratus]|nr:hypothetical protein BTVI_115200 [Pitangus sulphuratus]
MRARPGHGAGRLRSARLDSAWAGLGLARARLSSARPGFDSARVQFRLSSARIEVRRGSTAPSDRHKPCRVGIVYVGKNLQDHRVQPVTDPHLVNQTRALSAMSSHSLNTSRDGDSTTSLASLFQCLTMISLKKFFLLSNLNLS